MLTCFAQARWECYRGGLSGLHIRDDTIMNILGLGHSVSKQTGPILVKRDTRQTVDFDTTAQPLGFG